MQVPSNIIINRIQRPSIYISIAMILWGMISTLSGVVHNFAGMIAIRFFIGFVEAAFLPGALLILSKWYTRRELTTRNAILFCGNLISNAFSSLVGAAVLSNMEGTLGHVGHICPNITSMLPTNIACMALALLDRRRSNNGHSNIRGLYPSWYANQGPLLCVL